MPLPLNVDANGVPYGGYDSTTDRMIIEGGADFVTSGSLAAATVAGGKVAITARSAAYFKNRSLLYSSTLNAACIVQVVVSLGSGGLAAQVIVQFTIATGNQTGIVTPDGSSTNNTVPTLQTGNSYAALRTAVGSGGTIQINLTATGATTGAIQIDLAQLTE